jgi:peptide/nickel transport system permease protein
MITYLARRLVTSIVVLIGVSIFIFVLLHATFPSPARAVLGLQAKAARSPPGTSQRLRRPGDRAVPALHQQPAARQPGLLLRGEPVRAGAVPGASGPQRLPVRDIAGVSPILIALPLGIFQAVKRNSIGDNVATSAAFILYSMPSFFLGLILIQVFALSFPIFSFEASQSNSCGWSSGTGTT